MRQALARLYPGMLIVGIAVAAVANLISVLAGGRVVGVAAGSLETLVGVALAAYGFALRADWNGLVGTIVTNDRSFPAQMPGGSEARPRAVRRFGAVCLVAGVGVLALGQATLWVVR
ncbi:MAG TPA: hypothetical protein VFN57_00355 [Thermomicrobiaceae bacterium]|nr:hypothetical protein [Thermomicrobiaceae bacterium]